MKNFLLGLILLCTAPLVGAQDFYVSPSGSDLNACTSIGSPCQTLNHVTSLAEALSTSQAVTVDLRGNAGPYYGADGLGGTWTINFQAANLITFETHSGDTMAEITGGVTTGAFTSGGPDWTYNLPTGTVDFNQLWIGGARRWRAGHNTAQYLYNASTIYSPTTSSNCPVQITSGGIFGPGTTWVCYNRMYFRGTDLSASWTDLASDHVEVLLFSEWTSSHMPISSITAASGNTPGIVTFTGKSDSDNTPINIPASQNHGPIPAHPYIIEGEKALEAGGQWYIDESGSPWVLHYMPEDGETTGSTLAVYPQTATLLSLTTSINITFSGLEFDYQNYTTPSTGYISVQGEPNLSAGVSVSQSNHISFQGCLFQHFGGWAGEFLGGTTGVGFGHNLVTSSAMVDIGGGGWRIGTNSKNSDTASDIENNDAFTQNLIDGYGRYAAGSPGLYVGNAASVQVNHNDITDGFYDGIMVGYGFAGNPLTANVLVQFNNVWNVMQGVLSDGGGIYTSLINSSSGNLINNNIVHDVVNVQNGYTVDNGYGAHGIYTDFLSGGVTITNNLVYRTTDTSYRCSGCLGITISNNIFAYSQAGCFFRGTALQQLAFTAMINICELGGTSIANPQADQKPVPGDSGWQCQFTSWNPCSSYFNFISNDYWEKDASTPVFVTKVPLKHYNGLGGNVPNSWQNTNPATQGPNEDLNSIIADPQFVGDFYGVDNFALQSTSPAITVLGFNPITTIGVGRTSPTLDAVPPIVQSPYQTFIPLPSAYGQPLPASLPMVTNLHP